MSKGMYVVMRPPGVCPNEAPYQGIELGDSYQQFLLKVWNIVSQHPKLKNNTGVMFELANEPVKIKGTDGTYGSTGDGHFQNLQLYFQAIVDKIRANSRNIIWHRDCLISRLMPVMLNTVSKVRISVLPYIAIPVGMAVTLRKTVAKV